MNIFINEWLNNPSWWFLKTEKIDNYIINKYEYLLDLETNITQENFLSYIVLYDQIPRHIFRNQDGNHIILYFLNKAIDIINKYKNQVNNLNELEWIFFMLPLRHTNIKENILYMNIHHTILLTCIIYIKTTHIVQHRHIYNNY